MPNWIQRLFHTKAFLVREEEAEQRNCELMCRLEELNESTKALRKRLDEVEVKVVPKETFDGR